MAKKTAADDAAPPIGDQQERVDNPFIPGKPYEAAPAASAATVIKLWQGGEHRKASDLFDTLSLGDSEKALVAASCPGWDELRNQ